MMRGRTDRLHVEATDYFASGGSSSVKRTDFFWLRLVGTGLWFLVFGLVTFVLGFVVLPVIRLLTPDRARRQYRSRAVLGAGMRFFRTSSQNPPNSSGLSVRKGERHSPRSLGTSANQRTLSSGP